MSSGNLDEKIRAFESENGMVRLEGIFLIKLDKIVRRELESQSRVCGHDPEKVAQMVCDFERRRLESYILVEKVAGKDEYVIRDGNHRFLALQELLRRAIKEGNAENIEKYSSVKCVVYEPLSCEYVGVMWQQLHLMHNDHKCQTPNSWEDSVHTAAKSINSGYKGPEFPKMIQRLSEIKESSAEHKQIRDALGTACDVFFKFFSVDGGRNYATNRAKFRDDVCKQWGVKYIGKLKYYEKSELLEFIESNWGKILPRDMDNLSDSKYFDGIRTVEGVKVFILDSNNPYAYTHSLLSDNRAGRKDCEKTVIILEAKRTKTTTEEGVIKFRERAVAGASKWERQTKFSSPTLYPGEKRVNDEMWALPQLLELETGAEDECFAYHLPLKGQEQLPPRRFKG